MIHDIGNLHGMFGSPRRVVSTDIWAGGVALTTVLEYAGDARAVCTWVDLPELLSFEETLEVYGSRERVIASFPTGWSRGLPTDVTVQHDRRRGPCRQHNAVMASQPVQAGAGALRGVHRTRGSSRSRRAARPSITWHWCGISCWRTWKELA